MLGTGLLMWFTHLTPIMWRTSATFVHDWLALTIGVVLAGHIGMALGDPEARRGMRTGSVSAGVGGAGTPAVAAVTESHHVEQLVAAGQAARACSIPSTPCRKVSET